MTFDGWTSCAGILSQAEADDWARWANEADPAWEFKVFAHHLGGFHVCRRPRQPHLKVIA